MNYAHPVTINIKTEKQTKEQVQQIAREIGVSLNALVNAYLKQLARTRSVTLSAQEAPSDRLVQSIRQAQRDRREGKASPVFDNAEDAIVWLRQQGI